MNIKMQCCGLVILLMIAFFYRQQRRLKIHTERIFLWIFTITTACVALDILSIAAITFEDRLPQLVVDLACKAYNSSLMLVSMSGLLYACVDAYPPSAYRKILRADIVVTAAAILAILLAPIEYVYDGAGNFLYTFGPSIFVTYVMGLAFLVTTAVVLVRRKQAINRKRFDAIVLWIACWLGSSVVQLLFKDLLLVGFGTTLGVLVLYVKLENPETYFDRQTGMFNNNALRFFLRERYDRGERLPLLCLVLGDISNLGVGKEEVAQIRKDFVAYLQTGEANVFRKSEDEVALLFEDKGAAIKAKLQMVNRFAGTWGPSRVTLHPAWIYLPDIQLLSDSDELSHILRYVQQNEQQMLGRYDIEITGELLSQMREERRVERMILHGIEKDRVEVLYQPVYNVKEQRFTVAEALMRIYDDEGRLVPPSMFLDVAEKNGTILQLGTVVFDKVCRFLGEERPEKYGLRRVGVNLSAVQCADAQLAENYIAVMDRNHLRPDSICLEIVESASQRTKRILQDNVTEATEHGIVIALDDFGAGRSNLSFLLEMPTDCVKFSRELCQAYFQSKKSRDLMAAAIDMVHGVGLNTVAQGVETERQFQGMEAAGADFIQGFYFSRPLRAEELMEFLKKHRDGWRPA